MLRRLREQPAWSASALEAYAACPVRWFVERHLHADDLEAEGEPLARGRFAHETLDRALRGLREQTGSARVTPDRLEAAREQLRRALADVAGRVRLSPNDERRRAALRRLEADLGRYLEQAAHDGAGYEPRFFEAAFGPGGEEGALPAFELPTPDGPVALRGRIDRIDVDASGRRAIVVDYKSTQPKRSGEKWPEERLWQGALYARAAGELLGLEPAGALYQPVRGPDLRPRGLVAEDADGDRALVGSDRQPAERVAEVLGEVVELAGQAAADARAGRLEGRPDTCTPTGCAFPALCRCV